MFPSGGWQVSEYARKSLINNVQKELAALYKGDSSSKSASSSGDAKKPLSNKKVAGAIQRGFGRTDRELMEDVASAFKLGFGAVARCGSCALLVFVDGGGVHVANGKRQFLTKSFAMAPNHLTDYCTGCYYMINLQPATSALSSAASIPTTRRMEMMRPPAVTWLRCP